MAANTKTPLQAVVSVICDCLCELPPEDQTRALEAARVTLGLRTPTPTQDQNPFQETRMLRPLPTVEIQMEGARAVVVNPSTATVPTDPPRQEFVVAGPRRVILLQPRQALLQQQQLQELSDSAPARLPRGYVRSRR